MEDDLNKRVIKIKSVFKKFFSSTQNIFIISILILCLIIQVYFFIKTYNQPLWWDESVYLLKAKSIAFGTPGMGVNPGRALLNSFIWSGLFKIGLNEFYFRIINLLLAVFTVGLYMAISKSIFKNNLVAIFTGFSLSVSWVVCYVSTRLFPDLIGLLLWGLLFLFFWKGYAEKTQIVPKYFYWIAPVFVLAIYAREMNLIFLPIMGLYMLVKEKFALFKKKEVYILILLALLCILPFFAYYYTTWGNPIKNWVYRFDSFKYVTPESAAEEGAMYGWYTYFIFMPDYLGWIVILLFLVGFGLQSKIFLGFDLLFKEKNTELNKIFLLLLFIFPLFLFMAFKNRVYDERYILVAYPAAYMIAGLALSRIYEILSKKMGTILSVILIIIILLLLAYPQLTRANNLIESKKTSYLQVKLAGEWIKENSFKNDIIFSQSQPQTVYYSERATYGINFNKTLFEKEIFEKKPRYLVLSVFENHPAWAYSWPSINNNSLSPVQAYSMDGKQPVLIIYEFNSTLYE
jgi:hypothetical protein